MPAMPPVATKLLRRSQMTRSAKRRHRNGYLRLAQVDQKGSGDSALLAAAADVEACRADVDTQARGLLLVVVLVLVIADHCDDYDERADDQIEQVIA